VFDPGVTNLSISVPVLGDTLNEALEQFFVNLFDPTNGVIVIGQARFRINNDDFASALSVNDVTVTEGQAGTTTQAVFMVTLSTPSGLTVTVDYTTQDGTATAPADYQTTFGTLTFPSGTTTQWVRVPVKGDNLFETNETFTLELSNPLAATLRQAVGTATI